MEAEFEKAVLHTKPEDISSATEVKTRWSSPLWCFITPPWLHDPFYLPQRENLVLSSPNLWQKNLQIQAFSSFKTKKSTCAAFTRGFLKKITSIYCCYVPADITPLPVGMSDMNCFLEVWGPPSYRKTKSCQAENQREIKQSSLHHLKSASETAKKHCLRHVITLTPLNPGKLITPARGREITSHAPKLTLSPGVEEPELTVLRKDRQSNRRNGRKERKRNSPRPEQGTPLTWDI